MSRSAKRRQVKKVLRTPSRRVAEPTRSSAAGELMPTKLVRKRAQSVGLGLMALFCIAGFSQVGVQTLWRGSILDKAEDNGRWKIKRMVTPTRGTVWSSDGKILARTDSMYEFSVDFDNCPKTQQFYTELGGALDLSPSEFMYAALNGPEKAPDRNKDGKPDNRVFYRQMVTPAQKEKIARLNRIWRANGISLSPNPTRDYPLGEQLSGVLGMVRRPVERQSDGSYEQSDKPIQGDGGIEGGQDKLLQGQSGFREGMLDRYGEFLPLRMSDNKDKSDGQDVTLTIRARLQSVVADQLRIACEKNKAENGVALVMDPQTGDVLACANWPSWDPKTNPAGYDFNPNFHAAFEPGSTFKILTLAKLLDLGLVTETDTSSCSGHMNVGKWGIGCAHGSHGTVTPERAIAVSCNLAAARWALKLPKGDFIKYAQEIGLDSLTHVGVEKEITGNLIPDDLSQVHAAIMGFGQGMKVTPIALGSAFCALANGGERVQPRLIQAIGEKEVPTKRLGRLYKPETSETMLRLMESVISSDEGTGHTLRIPGYRLAGKTGTAERKGDKKGGYVANFVGFVPAQNPRAVVLVMINRPQAGSYYGGAVSGPVFHEIARDLLFNEFKIPRDSE